MKKYFSAILYKLEGCFMLIINILFTVIFSCQFTVISSQSVNKYWVFLKDKQGTTFNPYVYLDKKSIERRKNTGLSLFDISDFPLNDNYLTIIKQNADSVSYESRWFNAISVYANDNQIINLKQYDFIDSIQQMVLFTLETRHALFLHNYQFDDKIDSSEFQLLKNQTGRMGGQFFRDKGIDGKGLRIAIFDGGFPYVDISPVFEKIRQEGRIIKTWNFPSRKDFVYGYNTHGIMVMSCIGGTLKHISPPLLDSENKNIHIGLATGAEYLLARTEVNSEKYSEEENWLAAVEWADKNGADIINSSLGYTFNRYFPEQMDGKTTLVTRAAEMAAKKGILVVNAAGNDGVDSWHRIGAPADGDSILSVGGIDPETDYHIFFSSYGPTYDKRLKPNVCAYGKVMASGKRKMEKVQGTSFSSPLVAGFAACAWQTNRKLTNMQLLEEIEKSADLYPYFDYAHGYGVPQAEYFTQKPEVRSQKSESTFEFIRQDSILKVLIKEEYLNKNHNKNPILFYNIQDNKGVLKKYFVISVSKSDILSFNINKFKKGEKLNVHFANYTDSFSF
jgi:serine protease AprX